jgi:hypothetical protein
MFNVTNLPKENQPKGCNQNDYLDWKLTAVSLE